MSATPDTSPQALPLTGIKVIDFSGYIAGPYCTMLLGDMGADVVKVEPMSGEQWRHQDPFAPQFSKSFIALNRNKKSVVLDLKRSADVEAAHALLVGADVLVHNYRPGVAERLGIGYADIKALNPRLVYAVNSAYGPRGPRAQQPGYDLVIQAVSGLIAANPRPDGKVPRRYAGIPLVDFTAGNKLAFGIMCALMERVRTGLGQLVESSLIEAALSVQRQKLITVESVDRQKRPANDINTRDRIRSEAEFANAVAARELYYRTYETADGYVTVGCLNVPQRRCLLSLLGFDDPWHVNPDQLPQNDEEDRLRRELTVRAETLFRSWSVAEWIARLEDKGVPCAPVQLAADVMDDEQAAAGGYFLEFDMPEFGQVRCVGPGVSVGGRRKTHTPPPRLGQHNEELLSREHKHASDDGKLLAGRAGRTLVHSKA